MHAPSIFHAASGAVNRPTLRFLTCGSVDDGKSTLIGRLLHEQNLIHDDHREALSRDSKRHGTTAGEVDYALLLDGLEAEREQGITIDVAYRYFATARRSFIVADTPGHEQYTRNMATGASNADLAVLLVDARKGLLSQTRRHALISSLLGIKHVVLAVNKIDLIDFDQTVFEQISISFNFFAADLGFKDITAIPISARHGDNISTVSGNTCWYGGLSLVEHLESVNVDDDRLSRPFRMPVQWVNRANLDFRGFAGTISSGALAVGEEVAVLPSGLVTRIASILGPGGEVGSAEAGDSVTVTLADEVDIARGDMLAAVRDRPAAGDQFAAHLIWMSNGKLMPGRSYLLKVGHRTVSATITDLKHRLDIYTLTKLAAKTLSANEIGLCNLATASAVVFDPYADNQDTGAFILIDRNTNETVAAGTVGFALRRASNVHRQSQTISRAARSSLMRHKPAVLWFTGLSGSGKSTIANLVEASLHSRRVHTLMVDGDNVRHGLNRDLGFTEPDRVENIRRVGEVAKLMIDAGLVVLCSFISPFEADRNMVRDLIGADEFIEVFVDTPLEQCIARDPKGLYRRALAGEIKNFTGVDQAYEPPEHPELRLQTASADATTLSERVIEDLVWRGII